MDSGAQDVLNGTIASFNHIEKTQLDKITNFKIIPEISKEMEQILRIFIDFHLGHNFKSLDFLRKLRFAYV